ncbi:MAG: amidohydrolase family protein [Bacillota bacterium]
MADYGQKFDYVIENGTIIDPKTNLRTIAHVGICGEKVTAVTRAELDAMVKIDATGKIVCPGFIDPHCHVDGYLYNGQCYARMGVTTAITGNCGFGPHPVGEFLDKIDREGFPINHGTLAGHSFDMRAMVGLEDPYAAASKKQIAQMVEIAAQSLEEGALGISLGLEYAPATTMEEITALAKLAAKYDKVMPVHSRSDAWDSFKALREVVKIQELTGVRVLVSHLTYQNGMGMMRESLPILEKAYEQGYQIAVDSGAYHAFATFIGSEVFCTGWLDKYDCTYHDVLVSSGPHVGKRLTKDLYEELRRSDPKTLCTAFVGKPYEVIEALQQPYVMVSTDGAVGSHQPGTGHPQDAGTYPRVFGRFVREMNALTMMEAIKKCTLMPARFFGLINKGWLGPGADADIVVFDPKTVIDTADYMGMGIPDGPPVGIEYVFVNGCSVVKNSQLEEKTMPGRAVRQKNTIWGM